MLLSKRRETIKHQPKLKAVAETFVKHARTVTLIEKTLRDIILEIYLPSKTLKEKVCILNKR